MKISINEPCHENWDAMTPNQQGAFCKSCRKDVVDFSKKSLGEIKDFFSKPQGKVCGRFEEKQLKELSYDDFFSRFRYWNFSKKFAVIFLLAFGFWIFSGAEAFGQNAHMMKGEVAYMPDKAPKKSTPEKKTDPEPEKRPIMGKIKCVKPIEPQKTEEPMIMGDIAVREPEITDPPKKDSLHTETLTNEPVEYIEEPVILGSIVAIPGHAQENPNTLSQPGEVLTANTISNTTQETSLKADSLTVIAQRESSEQLLIYPNPSKDFFIVETSSTAKQRIFLYDENGRLLAEKEIYGTTKIETNDLLPGNYSVIMQGNASEAIIRKKLIILK